MMLEAIERIKIDDSGQDRAAHPPSQERKNSIEIFAQVPKRNRRDDHRKRDQDRLGQRVLDDRALETSGQHGRDHANRENVDFDIALDPVDRERPEQHQHQNNNCGRQIHRSVNASQ